MTIEQELGRAIVEAADRAAVATGQPGRPPASEAFDTNEVCTSVDVAAEGGRRFRISWVELERIDRTRELLDLSRKVSAGKMTSEEVEQFFKFRDEHIGKPKK